MGNRMNSVLEKWGLVCVSVCVRTREWSAPVVCFFVSFIYFFAEGQLPSQAHVFCWGPIYKPSWNRAWSALATVVRFDFFIVTINKFPP